MAFEKTYYALTNKKNLLKFAGERLVAQKRIIASGITAGAVDNKGDIWVGTTRGLLIYSCRDLSLTASYTAASGLSDNVINYIYKDIEGNMWIGTDGDGLFKFSGGAFAKLDNTNGLPGKIVMGIAKDNAKNLFVGTREGGLIKYDITRKKITVVNYSRFSKTGINAMASVGPNNLFAGTMDNKLLHYNGKVFKEIFLDKYAAPFINTIVAGSDKVWVTTSTGCYYLKGDSVAKINGIDGITIGVLPLESNGTLVRSTNGVYLLDKDKKVKKISVPVLQDIEVRCLTRFHDFVLIGTADEGIYCWKLPSDQVYKCDSKNGLSDNQVFSVFVDSKDNIWAGTGTGIQKIFFDQEKGLFSVKKFSSADGYENSESNLNAMAEDEQGAIWIGTTSGAFIFKEDTTLKKAVAPYIVIQNAESPAFTGKTNNKQTVAPWYPFPVSPILPYSGNKINFTVKGIFFKDPESVTYSYQLAGYDTAFSPPVTQTFFNYQSLEPGQYSFRVKAFTADGVVSENMAAYSFSVAAPFYKSRWFLLLIMGALVLTGVFIQWLLNKAKLRKQQQLELLRLDEQQKIRQRTAEDFHDELGNRLTRIALLADILQKKMEPGDTQKIGIIKQIKENVQALYAGTKDVIWSLSPASDNFLEVLHRIKQFGDDLFLDSAIHFSFKGLQEISPDIKMPADYSRNIIMIFKELLNNSLRHSQASKICITVKQWDNNGFLITQVDNGIGFSQVTIKRGNGLNNIQRRVERIAGVVDIDSDQKAGVTTILRLKIPLKGV